MKHYLTILLISVTWLSTGQTFKYPEIKKEGESISDFIPFGWAVRDSVSGIMDKRKVHILVLQFHDTVALEKKVDDKIMRVKTFPRLLLAITKDSLNGRLMVNTQNNRFIPTMNDVQFDVPEPYEAMTIENDILKIKLLDNFAPRVWYSFSYKFRLRKNSFTLIGTDVYYTNGVTGDSGETTYNLLTKRAVEITKPYNMDRNRQEKPETRNYNIEVKEMRSLNTMTEFKTWQILPGEFL